MTAPFDDIRALLDSLPGPSETQARRASLGRLDEIGAWLAAWSGRNPPSVNRPIVAIYAGAHGVAAHLPEAPPPRGAM